MSWWSQNGRTSDDCGSSEVLCLCGLFPSNISPINIQAHNSLQVQLFYRYNYCVSVCLLVPPQMYVQVSTNLFSFDKNEHFTMFNRNSFSLSSYWTFLVWSKPFRIAASKLKVDCSVQDSKWGFFGGESNSCLILSNGFWLLMIHIAMQFSNWDS